MALSPTSSRSTPAAPFNGGTITEPLVIDNATANTQGLTVDAPTDATGATSRIARFRRADGVVIFAMSSIPETMTPPPVLYLTDSSASFSLPASGNGFSVADTAGNANLSVASTGGVAIAPPSGSTDDPLTAYLESGAAAFQVAANGTVYLGAAHAYVSAGGALVLKQHVAPTDGSLFAGECALWFDQTDGAAKLMVKGKSANGTVVTGSLALG